MKSYKKLVIIVILAIILLSIIIIKKPTTQYALYDKDGNLLEDINYSPKDINVVLVVFNTLRGQNIGAMGYQRDTTPNIDKFAKENTLFTNTFATWTKTTPSMVSILTGQYPHTTGVMRDSSQPFPKNLTSIAEILNKNDYKTLGVAANPNTGKEFNFDQGFDEFVDIPIDVVSFGMGGRHTEQQTQKAIELIEKNKEEKFFLYLHYLDPHGPYTPPLPYNQKYVDDKYFNKYNKYLLATNKGLLNVISEYQVPDNLRGSKTKIFVDYLIAQYDGEINYVDHNVGILLNKIKELNLDKNTLIILMSDHGSSMGEHNYWFEHGAFAYDATAHVLLTMQYPKLLPKNKIIDEPTSTINVIPTILDITNIPVSKDMEGKSLLPLILKDKKIDEYVYGEGGYNKQYITTIRDKKWKLIKNTNIHMEKDQMIVSTINMQKLIVNKTTSKLNFVKFILPLYELYDIENDPEETINLINQEQEIADKLMDELYKWLNKTKYETIAEEGLKYDTDNQDISEETRQRLQSLGYLN